jgi:uncharacterized protein (TIGR02145 family)
MQSINILTLSGHPPFNISICDITKTYCYVVALGVTTVPLTVETPIELNGSQEYLVVITDNNGCETFQSFYCITPTPTPTLTPTPTPTPTNISCNCLSIENPSGVTLNFGFIQCDGSSFYGPIYSSTTLYVCGKLPYGDSGLIITTSSNICVGNVCPGPTPTPTPSITISPTVTPTSTITPTPTSTPNPCPNCVENDIIIGTQTWAGCNLNVSTYRNGDLIPEVTDQTTWSGLTTGAWCYYNNDSSNGIIYGKLYNWYAVNDPRGLAPLGYHVPSDTEWTTLTTYLGGLTIAGGSMKETGLCHWLSPNTSATNSSNFTGLPGGYRDKDAFYAINGVGNWWSSSEIGITGWYRFLNSSLGSVGRNNNNKLNGFSVRLIKD